MDFEKKLLDSLEQTIFTKRRTVELFQNEIKQAASLLADTLQIGGKILLCGNGGSAADSQHIAAELVVRLRSHINRVALPAIALTVDTSILTAGGNDIGFDNVFSRQVEAYGNSNDTLVAISTSGNSENVLRAVYSAKKKGMRIIGLLGKDGGKIKDLCDISVVVPSSETARIQETHIFIAHLWCEAIEEILFPELFNK